MAALLQEDDAICADLGAETGRLRYVHEAANRKRSECQYPALEDVFRFWRNVHVLR